MKEPTTIRQAIRDVVKRRKLTHLQVSILTGVDTGTISRFLSGRRGVTDRTADRLLAGLGLKVKA